MFVIDLFSHFVCPSIRSFGGRAGAVYVFSKSLDRAEWKQVAKGFLLNYSVIINHTTYDYITVSSNTTVVGGSDMSENSLFGSSVAMFENRMLVGAQGANFNGKPEIQSIFCSADIGRFRLHFRGWSSPWLGVNTTRDQLLEAILSDPRNFSRLYSITSLDVKDWGADKGGLCANNTAYLTFYSPWYGSVQLFGKNTGPDLELLTVSTDGLTYNNNVSGVVVVREVRSGSSFLDNFQADPQQVGAVYLFKSINHCNAKNINFSSCFGGTDWIEETKLFPASPQQGSLFGASVALGNGVAVAGSPGAHDGTGLVYVYGSYNDTNWHLLQAPFTGVDSR